MKDTLSPEEYYRERLVDIENALRGLRKRKRYLGLLRLFIVLSGILVAWLAWQSALTLIPFFILFLFAVKADLRNRDAIRHQERLMSINQQELDYLKHHFSGQPDGAEFMDDHHPYAEDLDIFGKASLYQYINRATSEQGKQLLSQWLKVAASAGMILSRQKAVRELSHMTPWRQEFQAHGQARP